MAKKGAKLAYIKKLRGICPEGYEMQYYKAGGQLCKKCMKKAQEGGSVNGDPVEEFKKGHKLKKDCGGAKVKFQGGSKINANDTIHVGKKIYNLSDKKTPYKKMTPNDYHKLSNSDRNRVDEKDLDSGRSVNDGGPDNPVNKKWTPKKK